MNFKTKENRTLLTLAAIACVLMLNLFILYLSTKPKQIIEPEQETIKIEITETIIVEPELPEFTLFELREKLGNKSDYAYLIYEKCCKYDIPLVVFYGMGQQESKYNPMAFNKTSKARGLFQVTPIVLKDYNSKTNHNYTEKDLYNPEINIEIAAWSFNKNRTYLKNYGVEPTMENLIRAFNSGCGKVRDGLYPQETIEYVQIVFNTCENYLTNF